MKYIKEVKTVKLWNSGYCSLWNFSKANSCEEARVEAVCEVARVCRGDKIVKDQDKLYRQLLTEHDGKPGSVFEFVPVIRKTITGIPSRFETSVGLNEYHEDGSMTMRNVILSNLRNEIIKQNDTIYNKSIPKGFFVFKVKVPQMIVKHILRHRMLSFQETSERTNKLREYYYCDEFSPIVFREIEWYMDRHYESDNEKWQFLCKHASQRQFDIWQQELKIRQELLNKGSHGLSYTTMWISGWKQDSSGWDNMFVVRTKQPAQREMIELANVIKQMMEE